MTVAAEIRGNRREESSDFDFVGVCTFEAAFEERER